MSSALTFSARAHTYAINGKRAPGVTTAIGKALNKPALPGAAAKDTAMWAAINREAYDVMGEREWLKSATGAYRAKWDQARDFGTLVHSIGERIINGDPVDACDEHGEPWPDDVIRAGEQLARFLDAWEVRPLIVERPVFNTTHWWAGTVDLVAELRDGRRWLIDYKTGASGIWPETSLQCSAYRHAEFVQMDRDGELEDLPMPHVDECAALWVRPDGWELRPVRADDQVYGYFLHMLPVASWASWRKEESIYDPLPVP